MDVAGANRSNPGEREAALAFDTPVHRNGYRWFYVDGLSDCGRYGIVVIAFVGSVFSPYYYRARARGQGDPYDYCAINVALYGPGVNRWAMTERGADALSLSRERFSVGRSRLERSDGQLRIDVHERSAPLARPVRGHIEVSLPFVAARTYALDAAGRHRWRPISPCARMRVAFARPEAAWSGTAYVDTNYGERPLESDFRGWDWSRHRTGGETRIAYHVLTRADEERTLSLAYADDGAIRELEVPPATPLRRSFWGVDRTARCAGRVEVGSTLEDAPFYARTMLTAENAQAHEHAMHESLSLDRFRKPWVRMLLPFRMPRVAGRRA